MPEILKILGVVFKALKWGINARHLIETIAMLVHTVGDLESGKVVSEQVGIAQLAGQNFRYGVWVQKI